MSRRCPSAGNSDRPPTVLSDVELVEREPELAAVTRALEDVAGGSCRTVGVLGEMGLGKTALLAAIGERARADGMLVLEGRAAAHERDVPFGLVIDALEDHVATLAPGRLAAVEDDLEAVLGAAAPAGGIGAAERFRHHRALRELLALLGRERPLAMLLDDLHWADEASVELVLHLLRRPPRGRVLLAFALRPVDPVLAVLEAARDAPGWEQLTLDPLSRPAALALLDRRARWRAARAGGARGGRQPAVPARAGRGRRSLRRSRSADGDRRRGARTAGAGARAAGVDRGRRGRRGAVRSGAGGGRRRDGARHGCA